MKNFILVISFFIINTVVFSQSVENSDTSSTRDSITQLVQDSTIQAVKDTITPTSTEVNVSTLENNNQPDSTVVVAPDTTIQVAKDTTRLITDSTIASNDTIQPIRSKRSIELGMCPTAYKGELGSYQQWTASWHVSFVLTRRKRLNGEFCFLGGTISGQNRDFTPSISGVEPVTYVNTTFYSGSYNLRFNILAKKNYTLYVSQGIGFMNFRPQNGKYEDLTNLAETRAVNEDFSTTSLMLPTQIGTQYIFNNLFGLGFKVAWLNTRTDYLDNISEWGNSDNNDNIMAYKFYAIIPIKR
ncbi:MAG: hypothetical protein GY827_08005 [Cytophagales bacterium]|nr:hypothetical protein [Cytophagales bacterium]